MDEVAEEMLADIAELDKAATPGPWYVHLTNDMYAASAVYVSTQPGDEQMDPGWGLAEGVDEQIDPAHVVAITLLQHP